MNTLSHPSPDSGEGAIITERRNGSRCHCGRPKHKSKSECYKCIYAKRRSKAEKERAEEISAGTKRILRTLAPTRYANEIKPSTFREAQVRTIFG